MPTNEPFWGRSLHESCRTVVNICCATGKGGHAAYPHDLVDPVIPAAELVGALQSLVSRETPPTDSAVISVSRFNTGTSLLCPVCLRGLRFGEAVM